MKIGLIIYGALETLSGGYLYDRQLVRHLRYAGHSVEIISLPWRNYAAHLRDNLRRGWLRDLAGRGYDLLLQDELNHPSLAWLNATWRQASRAPIIAIVHHLRSSEAHPRGLLPLYRSIETRYLRSVDGFLCNSHTTQASVQRLLAQPRPSLVAYPAADHLDLPNRAAIVAALAAKQTSRAPVQILFVGNLIPRKGLHHLLDGLWGIHPPSWHLHVVGSDELDPAYAHRVRALAANLHSPQQITWHGRVEDATLCHLYHQSDLLVVPSYEGFGIAYLEAMAFGLPVIAADTGAAHEIVTPGVNGALVPLHDPSALRTALHSYIANRVNLAAHGYAARQRFEQHPTWNLSMQAASNWLHETTNRHHA